MQSSPAEKADLRRVGLNPNYWYPLALAKDLPKGRTLATAFAGEPIVLVRTRANAIFALEDRCAHRQMPLSRGVVVGDCLRCCYHGWTYDKQGGCVVPYLPTGVSPPRGVRSYPARQAYGLIFVFTGDPALAEKVPLPDIPECLSRNFMAIRFRRQINCHYSFMHENLMDMSHQFLHRRWMGKFNPTPLAIRKGADFIEVDYTADLASGSPLLRNLPSVILKLQRGDSTRDPAGNPTRAGDFVTVCTRYPYQSLLLRRPGIEEPLLRLWLAYVPVDCAQRINRPTGLLIVRRPPIPGLLLFLRPVFEFFANVIYREDRLALEAEQQAYDLQDGDWNQEVQPFLIELRALLTARGICPEPRAID